jgi:UPF0755 protein
MKQRTPVPLVALAAGLVAFAVVIAAYAINRMPGDVLDGQRPPGASGGGAAGSVEYTVAEGATAASIGDELEQLGVIESSQRFQLLVRLMGVQDELSAGDYELPRHASALTIIDTITVKVSGPVLRVTFPEGIRVEEMAVIAERAGIGTEEQFLAAVESAQLPPDLAAALPPPESVSGYLLQGYLFPDTYILPRDATAADLVNLMIRTFDQRFTPELRAAALVHGLNTHQAVTLAAIVEREAVLPAERPVIAGVFLNRIAAGDLLGADPTAQFAAALDPASVAEFGWWKKDLTEADLNNPSPYNTREVPGLPPGPITNPGLASLEAVANAAQTDFYYFVADAKKGDGSHVFAETLEQHEQNKVEYGSP